MKEANPLRIRVFRAILFGRFEPIETIIAISAIIHGVWLLFPYWSVSGFLGQAVASGSRPQEAFIGGMITLFGLFHLAIMATNYGKLRQATTLTSFVFWAFLSWLSFLGTGLSNILWVPYITIMLASGVIYLNVSMGMANE